MASKTIVFITGANQGIGYETTKALLTSPGFHVIVGSRDAARGTAALRSLASTPEVKGTASTVQIDITDVSSVESAVKKMADEHGHIDVLVNNAGVWGGDESESLTEVLARVFNTNALDTAHATEAFLPLLQRSTNQPRLLFVTTSMASFAHNVDTQSRHYGPWAAAYRVSKVAVNMLMVQYAAKLVRAGVVVFGVDPGFCATNVAGDPDLLRKMGAAEPLVGGKFVASVARGERVIHVGKVVEAGGVCPW